MKWNIDEINNLISNKVEESLNLDYKAAGSLERDNKKTNEISKDISAFTNSDGGIIIYGIKEDKENKHLPGEIDPINRDLISKEWLENVIQNKIRPRIEGIIITPIDVSDNPKDVIYVVEVPKSNTAHQADDKKYYKRFNFNSEPMYDYEIRDIMNRSKNPEIDIEFEIIKKTYEVSSPQPFSFNYTKETIRKEIKTDYTLNIYAKNNGKVLANYINAYIIIHNDFLRKKKNDNSEYIKISVDNTIRDIVDADILPTFGGSSRTIPKYGPSRYEPILPRIRMKIKSLSLNEKVINSDDLVIWTVYCDNSEPREGHIAFRDIKVKEI